MNPAVHFWVPGVPAPQGSKRAVTRGGKVRLIEMSKRVKPWRQAVSLAASRHVPFPPGVPLSLLVEFRLPRPKAHYGTGRNAAVLKASAPKFVTGTPDADKLLRSSCDGLTDSGVIADDSQLVFVSALKCYADSGSGAWFTIYAVRTPTVAA